MNIFLYIYILYRGPFFSNFGSTAKLRFFIFWLSAPPVKQACVKA